MQEYILKIYKSATLLILLTHALKWFTLLEVIGSYWWLLVVTVNCYTDIGFRASAQSRFIGFGNTY